nr:putative integron gene cassette protein [uncultured bacterium]
MSFDLYVQAFEDGKPAGIPHAFVRQVFDSYLTEVEADFWTLTFSENEACSVFPTIHDDSTDLVHGLSIGNPCDNPVLWQCLASLLSFGNTVLYFPGGPGPLALDALVASHMPKSLGSPIIVSNGQDIQQIVLAA